MAGLVTGDWSKRSPLTATRIVENWRQSSAIDRTFSGSPRDRRIQIGPAG
jgi:hypothetical protein